MKKVSVKELKKKRKGFTLIELIVVIAIIAILAAMAIPKLSEMKKSAKVSNDIAAAKNIHTIAAMMEANGEWDGKKQDVATCTKPDFKAKLDGAASSGKSEYTDSTFTVEDDGSGNITVTCSGAKLYPLTNEEKQKYIEVKKS